MFFHVFFYPFGGYFFGQSILCIPSSSLMGPIQANLGLYIGNLQGLFERMGRCIGASWGQYVGNLQVLRAIIVASWGLLFLPENHRSIHGTAAPPWSVSSWLPQSSLGSRPAPKVWLNCWNWGHAKCMQVWNPWRHDLNMIYVALRWNQATNPRAKGSPFFFLLVIEQVCASEA